MLPAKQPTSSYAPKLPLIDNGSLALTIGDRLSDAGVSWAWFAGGWDNASGNVGGPGWTNGSGSSCSDPASVPAGPDIDGQDVGFPRCPDQSFQFHHQPFTYYSRYAPRTPGRAKHLKDEADFLRAVRKGTLPRVSFVKPLGIENEHPGYASESTGSDHLVRTLKAIQRGPDARRTLVVVTYDEFGGQWDHVSPPGQGRGGPHDQFGPGTRIPALLISAGFTSSGVSHRTYDTTSIMATIEKRYGLSPVDHPAGVVPRDRKVAPLGAAIRVGKRR